jgi:hypothetical protein
MEKSMSFATKSRISLERLQNLDAICSGGKDAVTLYVCDVYDPLKFCSSKSVGVNESIRDLSTVDFDNTTEAIEVSSERWKLWPDKNFKDRNPDDKIQPVTLSPGKYSLKKPGTRQ